MFRTIQIVNLPPLARRARLGCALLFSMLWLCLGSENSFAQISTENKIKATYLFNFPQFVEWPAEAYSSPNSPFIIGILGSDPFGRFLDDLVKGEKVGAHPIEIQRYRSVNEIDHCHLLYVSASEEAHFTTVLQKLDHKPVLNVGESSISFARRGGMISFFPVAGKVRFRVNLEPCETARLKLSSKLLRMAEVVPPGTKKE
jgi:hypothetical protein